MSLDFYLACDGAGDAEGSHPLESWNYTHNVIPMWKGAGCYKALYESEGKRAHEVVDTLEAALKMMRHRPDIFIKLNPSNLWGDYLGATDLLEEIVRACRRWPNALIHISA